MCVSEKSRFVTQCSKFQNLNCFALTLGKQLQDLLVLRPTVHPTEIDPRSGSALPFLKKVASQRVSRSVSKLFLVASQTCPRSVSKWFLAAIGGSSVWPLGLFYESSIILT